MSRKSTCPVCDSHTSNNYSAFEREDDCPNCKTSFDTIQKINDRLYSIFIIDLFLDKSLQYSKKVIASTTVMGNSIQFRYELLTKNKDSITTNFIKNSLELLNTVKISNGI